jgi:hypothetical protein
LKNPAREEFPDWLPQFQTATEEAMSREISNAHNKIREMEAEIAKFQDRVAQEQSAKLLFTATGEPFALSVATALRQLGLNVIEGPKQRADLIAWDGKRLAAIEAKGLEGGAREKNIGQVKRWTADVSTACSINDGDEGPLDAELALYREKLSELGVPPQPTIEAPDCKGIAILGTYRKLSLDQRPESFNDPVKRVIVRSNVCALTGLQLFTLVQEARATPSRREAIMDALFNTNGVLDEGRNWQPFLQTRA